MASISKLSIRGVRSFSPDDDEQVIAFGYPLTIIVGANGCGKTTIIEALKYSITGALPPALGTKSGGQAFVHDPKSYGTANVKANIKLRFNNRAGHSMVVIRSMEVTQKKTALSFKALDGILRTTDPTTGERVSMSHKCGELDRQIPQMMGVSKAILEHVMFCHQEESNWPLREGAELKKRFDDIFDSTRYAKALKAIEDTKKKFQSQVKDLKAELTGLNSHKFAAEGFRRDLDSNEERLAIVKDEIESCIEKISEEEKKTAHYFSVLKDVENLQQQKQNTEHELEIAKNKSRTLKDMLAVDFTGTKSIRELKNELHNFETVLYERQKLYKKYENEMSELLSDIGDKRQEIQTLSIRRGALLNERDAHNRVLDERFSIMKQISVEHDISLKAKSADLTESDIARFSERLFGKLKSMKEDLAELRSSHQREEDIYQSELAELTASRRMVENELSKIREELNSAQTQFQSTMSQSMGNKIRKNDVEEARQKAEGAVRERDEHVNHPRIKRIPEEIKENEDKISQINRKIEDETDILAELRRCADEKKAINLLEEQIKKEQGRLTEAYNDNVHSFEKYHLSASPDDLRSLETLANSLRDLKVQKMKEQESAEQQVSDKQEILAKSSALLENDNLKAAALRRKLSPLKNSVEKARNVVMEIRAFQKESYVENIIESDIEPQKLLEHINIRLQEYSSSTDSSESVRKVIKALVKMTPVKNDAGDIDATCPCCMRTMNQDEAKTFSDRMQSLLNPQVSDLLRSLHAQAQENVTKKSKYERWQNDLVEDDTLSKWQSSRTIVKEIEELNASIKGRQEAYHKANNAVSESREISSRLKIEIANIESVTLDAVRLRDEGTRLFDKLSEAKIKKDRLSFMAPSADNRELMEVESSLASLQGNKETCFRSIQQLNKELSSLNSQMQYLNKRVSEEEQNAREKEEKYNLEREINERKIALKESIEQLGEEERSKTKQIGPLRQKLLEKETDKERLRKSHQSEESKMSAYIEKLTRSVSQYKSATYTINQYSVSNKENDLLATDKLIEAAELYISQKEKEQDRLEEDTDELRNQLGESETHEKLISDNISLLEYMGSESVLKEKLTRLEEELEAISGFDTSQVQYNEAKSRIKEYEIQKGRCEGKQESVKGTIREIKHKLNTQEYKDIEERHRIKMIEHETTVIAVSDLETYHASLDRALLRYHGIKVEDINKIIRELWQICYRGEDITNIEIVSDGGGKASKSYNYRVVMTKNGCTPLDMRGRCSAGQRVLAGIVIRLALAETFCLNCGVMTLDEPTTNLDYENKQGLAIALAQIIASRAAQSNFQLVIITHDEDFVVMMKRELATTPTIPMPDRYFQVSREEADDGKFYSKISAVNWDEI